MWDRWLFVACMLVALACAVGSIAGLFGARLPAAKLMNTASALTGLASIFQLKVSGWFTQILEVYGNEKNFPFGPPSAITRRIIDNPDRPVSTAIYNLLFYDPETGAYLAVVSLILAIAGTWL